MKLSFLGLIARTTKLAKQSFNDVACLLVHGVQGYNPRRSDDETPPLFFTHNEIHDVDGTFFVTFNGLLQCKMD